MITLDLLCTYALAEICLSFSLCHDPPSATHTLNMQHSYPQFSLCVSVISLKLAFLPQWKRSLSSNAPLLFHFFAITVYFNMVSEAGRWTFFIHLSYWRICNKNARHLRNFKIKFQLSVVCQRLLFQPD